MPDVVRDITDPWNYNRATGKELFGREPEVADILARLDAAVGPEHIGPLVGVVGETRVGKSSVCEEVVQELNRRPTWLAAEVDTFRTPHDLRERIGNALATALSRRFGAKPVDPTPEGALGAARANRIRTVVLFFDDIDRTLRQIPEGERPEAFRLLRRAGLDCPPLSVACLLNGRRPLVNYAKFDPLGDWQPVPLGPLDRAATERMLNAGAAGQWLLPPWLLDAAWAFGGGHPFLTKLVAKKVLPSLRERVRRQAPVAPPVAVAVSEWNAAIPPALEEMTGPFYWVPLTASTEWESAWTSAERTVLASLADGARWPTAVAEQRGRLIAMRLLMPAEANAWCPPDHGEQSDAERTLLDKGYLTAEATGLRFRIGAIRQFLLVAERCPRPESPRFWWDESPAPPAHVRRLFEMLREAPGAVVFWARLAQDLWPGEKLGLRDALGRLRSLATASRAWIGDEPEDPRMLIEEEGRGLALRMASC